MYFNTQMYQIFFSEKVPIIKILQKNILIQFQVSPLKIEFSSKHEVSQREEKIKIIYLFHARSYIHIYYIHMTLHASI